MKSIMRTRSGAAPHRADKLNAVIISILPASGAFLPRSFLGSGPTSPRRARARSEAAAARPRWNPPTAGRSEQPPPESCTGETERALHTALHHLQLMVNHGYVDRANVNPIGGTAFACKLKEESYSIVPNLPSSLQVPCWRRFMAARRPGGMGGSR